MTSYVKVNGDSGYLFFRSGALVISALVCQSVFDGQDWTVYVYGYENGRESVNGHECVRADWYKGEPANRQAIAKLVARAVELPEEAVRFVVR